MIEMRLTGEMNHEGGARWYASETCFRLYSLLMTNGQEKEGRHEKCPYVDVKYVVSGTMRKENQNRYWPTFGAGIRAGVPAGRATSKKGAFRTLNKSGRILNSGLITYVT